jgi:leucyl aminopeptidase
MAATNNKQRPEPSAVIVCGTYADGAQVKAANPERSQGHLCMEMFTTTSAAHRRSSDCIIVGVYGNGRPGKGAADIDAASKGHLGKLIKQGDISGKPGSSLLLSSVPGVRAKRVLVVGLGKPGKFDIRQLRRAIGAAARVIRDSQAKDIVSYLGLEDVADADIYYRARYTVETIGNSIYKFTETKTGRHSRKAPLKKIGIAAGSRGDAAKALRGAEHAQAIVDGMSLARDLGNLPPNICTPAYLARTAQKIARQNKSVSTRVLGEAEIKRLGMHSFLSVTAGTTLPAKLILMQYKGAGRDKPVVLVGKGITFDAGGISLKPGPGMDEMKFDMCGAASVIATMLVVAKLRLPINLNVVVPACENLPSGTATRPGDIISSMSGKTIEVLNTDAEGRLILCDALTYSRRFKPEVIIDVATLTGACVIALGQHRTAVMSRSDKLANEITAAGISADDRGWHMPMAEEYEKQLKSNFADFANVGGRDGGAITAACFLSKFTEGMNWAHLDIAGTAWQSGIAKGSTGRPVPMLSEFILRRARVIP